MRHLLNKNLFQPSLGSEGGSLHLMVTGLGQCPESYWGPRVCLEEIVCFVVRLGQLTMTLRGRLRFCQPRVLCCRLCLCLCRGFC